MRVTGGSSSPHQRDRVRERRSRREHETLDIRPLFKVEEMGQERIIWKERPWENSSSVGSVI